MPETIVMRGAHLVTDARLGPKGVIRDGAVVIASGLVVETGPYAALAPRNPGARVLGDGTQLLLPGLVDAHSHGRGLSPIQKGTHNGFLENALFDWAYGPALPPELSSALCAWRHLRSGCTLLHHNGFDDDGPQGARRARTAIATYLSTGIRLAFSPGLRDESKLAMGGEDFLLTLPPGLAERARPFVHFDREALIEQYFRLFDELYEAHNGADTRILLAPCWAHGASEYFLRRVRAKADEREGAMIHMHLLQSPVQKAYGLRRHNKPTVFWLDDLGLVEENVCYGHAIHVTAPEIELMGRRR
ncbi:MAG TPA: amidohydrolase family protein, partial [Stellaceae bacterium]|nr:amidohydrolase family protein [Stellaceae bacterium]